MKKILFVFSIFFFFQSALLALAQTNPDKIELVHLLMGDIRPVYTPVTGAILDGGRFECEVGDTIKFKAQTQPPEPAGDANLYWSGTAPGCNGTGRSKTLIFANIGMFTVTVSLQSTVKTCTVYVNNNKTSPIKNVLVTKSKDWAHVTDESITLTVTATDNDWSNGVLNSVTNNIDLTKSAWTVGSGTLVPATGIGSVVDWSPSQKGQTQATVTVDDKNDYAYSPREDVSLASSSVAIGGFIVEVLQTVSGSKGTNVTGRIDENGNVTGTINSVFNDISWSRYYFANAVGQPSGSKVTLGPDVGEGDVTITWTFQADPPEAVFSGFIEAELTANLAGSMTTYCWDGDFDTFTSPISWDPSIPLGLGFKVTLPDLDLAKRGRADSSAALTYSFDSTDLGTLNPDGKRLDDDSNAHPTPLLTPGHDERKTVSMSTTKTRTISKSNSDKVSRARYQSFYKAQAESEAPYQCEVDAAISAGVITNVKSVKYKK